MLVLFENLTPVCMLVIEASTAFTILLYEIPREFGEAVLAALLHRDQLLLEVSHLIL